MSKAALGLLAGVMLALGACTTEQSWAFRRGVTQVGNAVGQIVDGAAQDLGKFAQGYSEAYQGSAPERYARDISNSLDEIKRQQGWDAMQARQAAGEIEAQQREIANQLDQQKWQRINERLQNDLPWFGSSDPRLFGN